MRDTVVFESDSDDDPEGEDNSDEGNDEEESEDEDEGSEQEDQEILDWSTKNDESESEDSDEVREMGGHWLGTFMWESKESPDIPRVATRSSWYP